MLPPSPRPAVAALAARASLVLVAALLRSPVAAQQPAPILLDSGGAAPGLPDPNVTYLPGPATAGFGQPFQPADFLAAQTGAAAVVRASLAGGWPRQLPMSPTARWIDTAGVSSSALYATSFQLAGAAPSAVLTIQFAADDSLGEPGIAGVYVNAQPVAATAAVGGYYFVATLQRDVGALLQQGQNWLHVYLRNTGGAGGVLFHARVQVDGGMIESFGAGCAGSAGTPLLLAGAASTQPLAPVQLDFYSLPPGAPVALLLGSTNATSFGMPTPVDLGFLGFAGCDGLLEPTALTFVLGSGGGASVTLNLPGARFTGVSLFAQGFVFDAAHARGASVTNGVELRAGY